MPTTTITLRVPGPRTGWLAIGLASGILVAAIASPAFAPRPILGVGSGDTTAEHTISVSGTGRVVISPDVADLRIGVSATKPTVKAAREAAAESMTRVVAALKKLGIADTDIQTTILSLQPVYDYSTNTNPPRLTGYTLANSVSVTVRNLDNVGDAIDNSLAAGATTFDGVSFRVDDPAKAEAQARAAAMAQAQGQGRHARQGRRGVDRWRRLDQRDGRAGPVPDRLRLRERRARGPGQERADARPGRHERGHRHGRRQLPDPVAATAAGRSGRGSPPPGR